MFGWLFRSDQKTAPTAAAPRPARPGRPLPGNSVAGLPQSVEAALRLHHAGHLAEAEAAYRKVLAVDRENFDALHFLGVIAHQLGNHEQAVTLITQALSLNAFHAPAYNNLGNAFDAQGKHEQALACYRKALSLQPDYVDAHVNLGACYAATGKLEEAIDCYQRALAFDPEASVAHSNLGNVLHEQGRLDEAVACHKRALSLNPGDPLAYSNLGNVLSDQRMLDDAIACYRKAIELRPDFAEAHSNLGNALGDQGELAESIDSYCNAIALKPGFAEAHSNLGNALLALGRVEDAELELRQALELQPDSVHGKFSYALLKLLAGDYETGLPLYECRFEEKALSRVYSTLRARSAMLRGAPRWQGEDAADRILMVWTDQGLGDSLMMMRYLPRLKSRGFSRVIVYCEPALVRTVRTIVEVDEVVSAADPPPFGKFDCHCPIMSLPLLFNTRLETMPRDVPYLHVPPELRQDWARKLSGIASPRIGVLWAGGALYPRNPLRSIRLERWSPLLSISGVNWVSLQKGEEARQLEETDWTILDRMDECGDLLDTAALIEQLDLVIGVDTAVAHLTGALGKPMWMMNRFESEWRWMLGREDSPWYPTMRIFRQARPGDWDEVIARVAAALKARRGAG
jgi:tetratricopeptide (TPR) repeat protein